jgi:hypothetical protein
MSTGMKWSRVHYITTELVSHTSASKIAASWTNKWVIISGVLEPASESRLLSFQEFCEPVVKHSYY